MMNDDLLHRVSLFLDNELNQEEQRSLMEEISGNEQYQTLLEREKSFKSFVKSHVARPHVSPSLIQSIKDKIRVSPS
ncbi:MAG: hypothetical protein J5I41_04750 [Saprospiraceae bacterium]|nr:hypothetical protein [Saprospiraceae bacterium]